MCRRVASRVILGYGMNFSKYLWQNGARQVLVKFVCSIVFCMIFVRWNFHIRNLTSTVLHCIVNLIIYYNITILFRYFIYYNITLMFPFNVFSNPFNIGPTNLFFLWNAEKLKYLQCTVTNYRAIIYLSNKLAYKSRGQVPKTLAASSLSRAFHRKRIKKSKFPWKFRSHWIPSSVLEAQKSPSSPAMERKYNNSLTRGGGKESSSRSPPSW